LVFNKFYTPEGSTNSLINIGASEGISLFTSTVSAQFNTLISKLFNSNAFSVGVDYRQSDQQSSDVQAQILYQPNNRLIVNGNFGYRNDLLASDQSNRFIGDVDIEWLLNESGKLRFKAYNHTIDRYQVRTNARTTQGLGIVYKEDFEDWGDLLSYYWKWLTNIGKKEKKNESETIEN
jgi:lipopolysaccharide assembly outer membrane protein LptD (OstA)